MNPTAFTRKRLLNFGIVTVLILRGHKISLQNALNKVFGALGKTFLVPSSSALCQARQKLKPEMFVHLNQVAVDDFYRLYGADGEVMTWRGHRVVGHDGTYINLPDTEELREAFTLQRNQHGSECVQALAGVLYDLRNDIGLAASLQKVQAEKNLLINDLWVATRKGDLLVMDRNFADYGLIAFIYKGQREVLVRCPSQSFGVVNDFWNSDDTERIVTLSVPSSPKTIKFVREHNLPEKIEVRLIKVTLETGEIEVLLTTLCDRRRYPTAEFKEVYNWRWCHETYYDRIKNIFEVERFSGFSKTTIEQDFHGVIFLATIESILTRSPQAELLKCDLERANKTRAKVNRDVSYVSLIDHVTQLLADPRSSPEDVLDELHHLFKKNPKRNREGRKFERKKLKHSQKLRFYRYIKRLTA